MTGRSTPDARVLAPWRATYDPALAVRRGQPVQVGREDDRWPGWWWVRDGSGLGGWVPADVLADAAPGSARVIADFDTQELTVFAGDSVAILWERNDWAWCRRLDGSEGWVPLQCLNVRD